VRFTPSYCFPKPVQSRVPVYIGAAAGPKTVDEIIELAEGWMPMTIRGGDLRLPAQLKLLRDGIRARGRDPGSIDVLLIEPTLAHDDRGPEDFSSGLKTLPGRGLVQDLELTGLIVGIPLFNRDRALAHLDAAASFYLA
jgi:hypothetical protein